MSEAEKKEISVEPFLDEDSELSAASRLHLFVQMIDEKPLIRQMQVKAMMIKMELEPPDPIYSFTMIVLRIVKPHLFTKEGGLRDN